jgi:hypothetical protein
MLKKRSDTTSQPAQERERRGDERKGRGPRRSEPGLTSLRFELPLVAPACCRKLASSWEKHTQDVEIEGIEKHILSIHKKVIVIIERIETNPTIGAAFSGISEIECG